MNKIIVLQGVPASGKSTWAREFVKTNKDYVIISRDSIRESRGNYWIPEQENYITDIEDASIQAAIKRKLNMIIDATNLNPKTIDKLNKVASDNSYSIEFKEFKISYVEAIERDKNRSRSVGKEVITNFFKKYYYDDYINEFRTVPDNIFDYFNKNKNLPKCVIFDMDSTLAFNNGRGPYDYDQVDKDIPNYGMKNIVDQYYKDGVRIIIITGREDVNDCYLLTRLWLHSNFGINTSDIYMRSKGSYKKSSIVKKELYNKHIKGKFNVIGVYDDDQDCIDMYKQEGLLTFKV